MLVLRAKVDPARLGSDIDVTLRPPDARAFRLIYLRAHFSGGSGNATLTLALKSGAGDEYNSVLNTYTAGASAEINWTPPLDEAAAWQFPDGDGLRILWTNPGVTYWAIELGYEPL